MTPQRLHSVPRGHCQVYSLCRPKSAQATAEWLRSSTPECRERELEAALGSSLEVPRVPWAPPLKPICPQGPGTLGLPWGWQRHSLKCLWGHSSIVLMNSTWLLPIHTILLIKGALGHTLGVLSQMYLILYRARLKVFQIFKFSFPFDYKFHLQCILSSHILLYALREAMQRPNHFA